MNIYIYAFVSYMYNLDDYPLSFRMTFTFSNKDFMFFNKAKDKASSPYLLGQITMKLCLNQTFRNLRLFGVFNFLEHSRNKLNTLSED